MAEGISPITLKDISKGISEAIKETATRYPQVEALNGMAQGFLTDLSDREARLKRAARSKQNVLGKLYTDWHQSPKEHSWWRWEVFVKEYRQHQAYPQERVAFIPWPDRRRLELPRMPVYEIQDLKTIVNPTLIQANLDLQAGTARRLGILEPDQTWASLMELPKSEHQDIPAYEIPAVPSRKYPGLEVDVWFYSLKSTGEEPNPIDQVIKEGRPFVRMVASVPTSFFVP